MARASADREEEGAGDHTPLLLLWSLLRYSLLGLGGGQVYKGLVEEKDPWEIQMWGDQHVGGI